MEINFNVFDQIEKPSISLCNPERTQLYSLNACYNTLMKLRWNGQSEFIFTYPQQVGDIELDAFDYLEGKREILIEGIGYFQITDVQDDSDGTPNIKTVTCYSQDSELVYKKVLRFSGTYSFSDLMTTILELVPEWSLGTIHADLLSVSRTFDISDSNVYQFLTKDVSAAFDCVFIFGYIDKTISAIPTSYPPLETDIFLSFDNLIKHTEYKEVTSEIATCLYCYGGNDLTIRYVNPLGTNAIYDFTYYKTTDWMSQGLVDALTIWETSASAIQISYADLVESLSTYQTDMLNYQSQLVELETQLAIYRELKIVQELQELDTTVVDAQIAQWELYVIQQNSLISQTQTTIDDITSQLTEINSDLSFTNTDNFTDDQYLELSNFIFENIYQNDSILITDSMTFPEIQDQSQLLYDMALDVLAKVSLPRYQITINSVNFLALKEYEPFIEQLTLGDQITVDSGKGYMIDATLLEVDFSYDNPEEFTIILGNRQRLGDANFVFADLFGQSLSTSSYSSASGSSIGETWVMEDLTGQIGVSFYTAQTYIADSLRIYVNGILQRKLYTYTESVSLQSFTMLDEVLTDDTLVIEYRIA